jgi:WD40 repeat protein
MSAKEEQENKYKELKEGFENDVTELRQSRKPADENLLATTNTEAASTAVKFKRFCAGKTGILQPEKISSCTWFDDKHALMGVQDGNLVLYSLLPSGSAIMRWGTRHAAQSVWMETVERNQFSQGDNTLFAAGGLDNNVTIIKVPFQQIVDETLPAESVWAHFGGPVRKEDKVFQKHGGPLYSVKWIDQTKLVSGSGDGKAMLWDMEQKGGIVKEPLRTLDAHELGKDVSDVCVMDKDLILTAGSDSFIKMFDNRVQENCGVVATYAGHIGAVTKLQKCGTTQCFGSVSEDSTLRIWDTRSTRTIQLIQPDGGAIESENQEETHQNANTALEFSSSCRHAWVGQQNGDVTLYDVLTGEKIEADYSKSSSRIKFHDAQVRRLARSPDGNSIMSVSYGPTNNVAIWSADPKSVA